MASGGGSVRVIIFALLANLGIAVSKFVGAFISGSASLFAEAIHSVVDCTNQVLLLIGNRRARHAPTDKHPLGFGREAFFWSFVVAILLFSLGGLFAIYEGIHKLEGHEPMQSPWIALMILIISIALEFGSFMACLKEVKAVNTHGSLWEWFKNTTAADLLVIFTEDAAALVGLALATAFLLLAWLTGNPMWDAVGSIVIGGVLVIVAVLLAIEIQSLIIGEAPAHNYREEIQAIVAQGIPGGRVIRFIAIQSSPHDVLLSMKITPGSVTEVRELIRLINEAEAKVKIRFPEVRWLFVEPDFFE